MKNTTAKFQTVIVSTKQADEAEKYLKYYSRNIRRADKANGTVEFHIVASEATMKRIVREVRL